MNSTLILPVAIMMGSSLAMKSYFKSWLEPGAFFSGIWTFFVIMPIIFAPSYPIYSFGLWVIVINMFAVGVGAMFGSQFSLASISVKKDSEIDVFRFMVLITYIFILMSFIGVIFLFFFGVSRFSLTNSLLDFLILPNQFSMDRYHGAVVIPPAVRTMMYLVYPASLMGGITFDSINSKWRRSLLLLPILVAVFYAFLLTTRSTILLSMILWFSGWLTMKFYWIKVKKQKNRFKSIILSII
ncbi:MAG: oligosaccharide repeat unit polymerase, partial [Candidatus Marinimicrobia bacterium]|nr:oligosaccharide repeat unit polymerase [Candidatus Neomarinimicrobiota bacterium]